ncbi:hypothetical protein AB6D11_02875 [Vibrio splendidus]
MKILQSSLLVTFAFMPTMAFAESNASNVINSLGGAIDGLFVVIGVVLLMTGIYSLYKRSISPQQNPLSVSIFTLLSAVMLISSTSFFHIVGGTVGLQGNTLTDRGAFSYDSSAYQQIDNYENSWLGRYIPEQTQEMVMGFVWLAGLVGFLRGILLIKDLGSNGQNNQGGGPGKVAAHIIGGYITMNIMEFSCALGQTFGTSGLCTV